MNGKEERSAFYLDAYCSVLFNIFFTILDRISVIGMSGRSSFVSSNIKPVGFLKAGRLTYRALSKLYLQVCEQMNKDVCRMYIYFQSKPLPLKVSGTLVSWTYM